MFYFTLFFFAFSMIIFKFSSTPQLNSFQLFMCPNVSYFYYIKLFVIYELLSSTKKLFTFIYLTSYMVLNFIVSVFSLSYTYFICTSSTALCTYYLELCFLTEFFIMVLDSFFHCLKDIHNS